MNAKFRDIGRISLRPSVRERDPVKLTRKKIAYLVGADKSNPEVPKKYKREVHPAVRGSRRWYSNDTDRRLFTEAGPWTTGLELAPVSGGRLIMPQRARTDSCNSNLITRKKGEEP
jgi:hypothetical protein